jgi:hypothetical protein
MGQIVADIVTPLVSSPVLENEVISRLGITPGRIEYNFASGERPDAEGRDFSTNLPVKA